MEKWEYWAGYLAIDSLNELLIMSLAIHIKPAAFSRNSNISQQTQNNSSPNTYHLSGDK